MLFVCLFACLFVCLFICLFVCLYVVCLFVCLFFVFVCLLVFSVCLFACFFCLFFIFSSSRRSSQMQGIILNKYLENFTSSLVHSTQSHCHVDLKVNPLVHVSNMQ